MKTLNKDKVLELLQELDDSLTVSHGILKDAHDNPLIDFDDELLIDIIEKGVLKNGKNDYASALIVEYLHQHKNEVIINEYTQKEVINVLEDLGLEVDGNDIIIPKFLNNDSKTLNNSLDLLIDAINGECKPYINSIVVLTYLVLNELKEDDYGLFGD